MGVTIPRTQVFARCCCLLAPGAGLPSAGGKQGCCWCRRLLLGPLSTLHSVSVAPVTSPPCTVGQIFLVISTNIFGPETGGRFWYRAAADHCALVDNSDAIRSQHSASTSASSLVSCDHTTTQHPAPAAQTCPSTSHRRISAGRLVLLHRSAFCDHHEVLSASSVNDPFD